jgi:hypothetical protein
LRQWARRPRADRHSPLPGGFGAPLVRHYDRSARSSLHWRRGGSSRSHPAVPGNAARSCVRGNSLTRAAVERRKASASRWTRGFARSAFGWQHPMRGEAPRDSRAYRRSASLHFFEAKRIRGFGRQTSGAMHRENASARSFRPREAGEGDHWSSRSERTVVEGAPDSQLHCCRRTFEASPRRYP